jgi:hypothetical protein
MKKTKRYDDGGYTGDDPIVKYRMGMIDDKGNDLTKKNEETSADLDPYGAAGKTSTPTAVEKTVTKVTTAPAKKMLGDDTINPDLKMRSDSVKKAKETIGMGSFPKSFKEAGGNTTVKKSSASMPSMKISLPDPLASFDSKGKRLASRDFDYKKGGAIKKMAMGGSASKRGDGIAMKGKTRGKIC